MKIDFCLVNFSIYLRVQEGSKFLPNMVTKESRGQLSWKQNCKLL